MAVNLCLLERSRARLFACVRVNYMHRNSFSQFIHILQFIGLPFSRMAVGVPVFRVNDFRPAVFIWQIFSPPVAKTFLSLSSRLVAHFD